MPFKLQRHWLERTGLTVVLGLSIACQTVPEKTYPVTGATTQDLIFDLKDNPTGPKDSWGHRGAAVTLCQVGLEMEGQKTMEWSAKRCTCTARLGKIKLDPKIEVTMPQWVNASRSSPDCRRKWAKFVAATRHHENGHVKICREGIAKIQSRLAEVATHETQETGSDCDSACDVAWRNLRSAAERVYRSEFKKLEQNQIDYDEETQHGQHQGGILAPCR